MKKFLSLMLALVMVFSLSSAFATQAQYKTTQEFLDALDDMDIKYTYAGVDNDGDEKVTVKFTLGESDEVGEYLFFFSDDEDDVYIRLWNIIYFNPSDRAKVLDAVNAANDDYKFVRFSVDDNTNSVDASWDCLIPTTGSGSITTRLLGLMIQVVDTVYPTLTPYAK